MLERPCPECGFDAPPDAATSSPPGCSANARDLARVLGGGRRRGAARRRTSGRRWSTPATSGTCTAVFAERVRLMLAEDDPRSRTGTRTGRRVDGGYAERTRRPSSVELAEAADRGRRDLRQGRGRPVGPDRTAQQRLGVHRGARWAATTCTTSSTTCATSPTDVPARGWRPCVTPSSGTGWSTRWGRAYARSWAEQQVIVRPRWSHRR